MIRNKSVTVASPGVKSPKYTVREAIPVPNCSGKICVHMVQSPGIWYKEIQGFRFSELLMIYGN